MSYGPRVCRAQRPAHRLLLAGRRVLAHGKFLAHGRFPADSRFLPGRHVPAARCPGGPARAALRPTDTRDSLPETPDMNATRNHTPAPPAASSTAVRSTAVRSAWWVLGAPALALAMTLVLLVADAPGDWIGAVWLVAVFWTIAASLVQALWAGFQCGDWSAFHCCAPSRDDDGHDWSTRTGAFAYLRIRDRDEVLTREADRFLRNHDRTGSPG